MLSKLMVKGWLAGTARHALSYLRLSAEIDTASR